jgi:hypothetical protein
VTHVRKPSGTELRRRSGHVLPDTPRKVPAPPKDLDASERDAWRHLWASPVSVLWSDDDRELIVRLIRLRARLDAEGVAAAPVSFINQIMAIEDRLILSPRARRQAGVSIVAPDQPEPKNGPARLKARERERLLRG